MAEQEQQAPGGPVPPWWTDPTENVISLVDAAMKRQDDLREMQARYVAQIGQMRESHATYVAEMRSRYERQLREAESGRIDAIRAVDVGAVNRAAEVQATQANTLAAQVVTTADAFRASLASALAPIQASIEDLRRAQYEAQGQKTQVVEARDVRGEARLNFNLLLAVVLGAVAVITLVLYVTKK
jgi:hypothetical protein